MIVVDTNIIGYLFLTAEHSQLSDQALKKDPDWAAPLIWRSEFRNVLAFYVREKIIKLENAHRIMDNALRLLKGYEFEVSSYEVLRLASESNCSAYDCEFIALAGDLNTPLITVDKQLLKAFPSVAISLRAFCV